MDEKQSLTQEMILEALMNKSNENTDILKIISFIFRHLNDGGNGRSSLPMWRITQARHFIIIQNIFIYRLVVLPARWNTTAIRLDGNTLQPES